MGRRRKEQASQDVVEAVEADAMDAAAAALASLEAEILTESVEEPAAIAAPSRWLVLEDRVVSLFGQMTTLPAGSFVSVASYGPEAIKRIMEQGVALEPVG